MPKRRASTHGRNVPLGAAALPSKKERKAAVGKRRQYRYKYGSEPLPEPKVVDSYWTDEGYQVTVLSSQKRYNPNRFDSEKRAHRT